MPRISAARRGPPWDFLLVALVLLFLSSQVQAQTTYHCNATTPCYNGACCGVTDGQGICGYGSDFCGDTCVSNCNATAACGQYAAVPGTTCPLNVCCSKYGFCGTESDFCDADCQSNCAAPIEPGCTSNDVLKRVIGYYEGWSSDRVCDSWSPSNIAASALTHLNSWALSVLNMLETYGFDGVDLDWEYPVASDRGGKAADKKNYVSLISTLRNVLDGSGKAYGISFTTPSSYWYLQNFDVPGMLEAGADWTNIMTYDLHGTWDASDVWIGSVMLAHTNLTEIKSALDLMWRAGVDASDIVLGIGFYGRSYTMSDTACYQPGCPFIGAGNAGSCTVTPGVLSYSEIIELMQDEDTEVIWDDTDAVNYMVWGDQWVSFDTNVTFQQKVDYANTKCLGGLMIWSVDQDTYDWQALSGLLGKSVTSNNLLSGGTLGDSDKKDLSHIYSAFTGTDCYVSECFYWNSGWCETGYSTLDYVHQGLYGIVADPDTMTCATGEEGDTDAQYRMICCPTDAMPEGCAWAGSTVSDQCGAVGCSSGQYELVADPYVDRTGSEKCGGSNSRSLCCNTDSALEKCSWSTCGQASFCCPSEDTYTGCDWYGCDDKCPDTKVLITQRSEIVLDGNAVTCTSGANKLCCDPPDGSNSWPVDPEDLFKYPDEENVSYYYSVQKSSNDEDTDNASEDPFALVMIDGDASAYDESLVDQWTFLDDENELSKRGLKMHKRHNLFEHRNDTFDNVIETYHIQCVSLFVNGSACTSIFNGGASNTIVKMPADIGAGPYARVIKLAPVGSDRSDMKPRSTGEVYELTVDYDFAAAAEEQKGDVNFRIDYTNLQEYWKDITDTPASRKRWFGSFDNWLRKMTTIVKDEKGSLPLDYEETIKLFHGHEYCPAWNTDATFDIDAFIHLELNGQYGYYFEGSILPTPNLISAYGYFSIEPTAAILLTIPELFSLGFPGMSIKGLINIGPELALYGQLDASLQVSGELNAGVALLFKRTEVYFPQDAAGAAASVAPADLDDNDDATYSFDPTFDAQLTAEGNLALSLTPEVRFGVSVLGGDLMSGYVTAGISNTINLGISAEASYSGDGASAGFCYWADYVYSIFLRADMSFLGDVAYWGGNYDVTSPSDPLELVSMTCTSYSSGDSLTKRTDTESLVANTTGSACFGGIISCQTIEDNTTTASNLSCPIVCDGSDSGSCTVLDTAPDPESTSSKKRQGPASAATNGMCYHWPALWYNCAWFPDKDLPNLDSNTNSLPNNQYWTAPVLKLLAGICRNVANYLYQHQASWSPGYMGPNFMRLTYKKSGPKSPNRAAACGSSTTRNTPAWNCVQIKSSLWPAAVQKAWAANDPNYQFMQGWSDPISCDEFPCRATACAPVEQQSYQSLANNMISHIKDNSVNMVWSATAFTGYPQHFTVNLFNTYSNQHVVNSLGPYGGYYDSGENLPLTDIAAGVNLFSSPIWSLSSSNAVCRIDGGPPINDLQRGISYYHLTTCQVIYEDPNQSGRWWKRDDDDSYDGPDHLHPRYWQIKGA
ncbi:hypothetical protein BDQ94DRAFT_161391 [Aspergillus welwitschiae]|uniref:chitinase n=1 Tax=Aspergillus welwitschiae TaxID=1341132 RepID=A0A3F3PUB5_9EURO|nr:hypothetical protein BDQ94DRAFT_161391 [Aspergillus welwitschiae]RDH30342.1 hypothetical protein BDQ94DRAFT_161391 [Aspergillus welwitschiae]